MSARQRLRGLRVARGWSLDDLAGRCFLSASTLSRLETGHRRIGLDQLSAIARALGTTIDRLVEPEDGQDVGIRPQQDQARGMTTWLLSRDPGPHGLKAVRLRLTQPPRRREDGELPVHPGRDWFTVLSGTVLVLLGARTIRVEAGQAAEFSTMVPHSAATAGRRRSSPSSTRTANAPTCVPERTPPRAPGTATYRIGGWPTSHPRA